MKRHLKIGLSVFSACLTSTHVVASDLEVSHWWTSGGESAAVSEFAKAFDATGNKWVDGAIAGSSWTAIPIIVSRIVGGNPMGAAQIPRGRQAEELIEAGLLRDIDAVAKSEDWVSFVRPSSLLDACTVDGMVYCVPVDIHSWHWLWLSNEAFEKAGVQVPRNWTEFVAAAPALEEAGVVPLAMGGQNWQQSLAFVNILGAIGGPDLYSAVFRDKSADAARGDEMASVFEAMVDARRLAARSRVQNWNEATNMVITGAAGGQIMGDWAQGEFQVAGLTAGEDYSCLPGLGLRDVVSSGGDAFYFPVLEDAEATKAQDILASTMISADAQLAFNLKKGALPVRGDVDLEAANECMRKGSEVLANGSVLTSIDELVTPDTNGQLMDLMTQFFADDRLSAADAQERFATIIESAD